INSTAQSCTWNKRMSIPCTPYAQQDVSIAGQKRGTNRTPIEFNNENSAPVIGPFLVKKLLLLGWFEHAGFGFPLAKSLPCLLPHHPRLSAFLPLPPPLCLVLVARLLLIPGNGALLAVLSSP